MVCVISLPTLERCAVFDVFGMRVVGPESIGVEARKALHRRSGFGGVLFRRRTLALGGKIGELYSHSSFIIGDDLGMEISNKVRDKENVAEFEIICR